MICGIAGGVCNPVRNVLFTTHLGSLYMPFLCSEKSDKYFCYQHVKISHSVEMALRQEVFVQTLFTLSFFTPNHFTS